jgi:hypothetical protein
MNIIIDCGIVISLHIYYHVVILLNIIYHYHVGYLFTYLGIYNSYYVIIWYITLL